MEATSRYRDRSTAA